MLPSKPQLYTAPPVDGGSPQLKGGACRCGHVFHPFQAHGCEKCGATGGALQPVLLAGAGQLVASARVLVHAGEGRRPPFVVVSVKLDGGPVVRTLLAGTDLDDLAIGRRMQACLVEVGRDATHDQPVGELRFARAA